MVLDTSGFLGGAASLNKDISAAPRTAAALEALSLSQNAEKALFFFGQELVLLLNKGKLIGERCFLRADV